MNDNQNLQTFPSDYSLKVMGLNTPEFEHQVMMIINKHVPNLSENAFSRRLSKDEKYLAVTANFEAQSKEQLDALYKELTAFKEVLMCL